MLSLLIIPLPLALLALLIPSNRWRPLLLPVAGLACAALALPLVFSSQLVVGHWFSLDPLGKLVLLVVSLLFAGCGCYGFGYLRMRPERDNRVFVASMLMFLFSMLLATLSRHLGLLWVAIEATTLFSAPLIYFNRNRHSIEATWKYLLICSVGIALAMLGIFAIAYAAVNQGVPVDLQLVTLLQLGPKLSHPWLQAGFIFLLIGFGTKMGLAPMHTWKPDTYGEAPGMVGALLAGGLTSVAFLGVMRGVQVMAAAGLMQSAQRSLLILGLLSVALAAVFMVRQPDIKRLLAYSSIEHMGILAIGVGIGGAATFGAMFHLLNNAFTKGSLFLCAGNLQRAFDSKQLDQVHGAIERVPASGTLLLLGFLAITGSPPFGLFQSEFSILRGAFSLHQAGIGIALLLLLGLVFIGMAGTLLPATLGRSTAPVQKKSFGDTPLTVLPPLLLLAVILLLGLFLPEPLHRLFNGAAALLEVQP
ncbi:hydrogenase [Geothermobacter hydrogeniphilus]|uniref:Hydrogenase n=1 Tax=Geothermobacter hydrogeniphilus TaxID=1969733 RepID=A0A2K2H9L1_9BACT|nr:proton-conducting transporter membrane subunit [Geothermobacter hydrogeniphilus]PNU19992.1 hydrogenase [Geothermobacter hydrogeniphilus]